VKLRGVFVTILDLSGIVELFLLKKTHGLGPWSIDHDARVGAQWNEVVAWMRGRRSMTARW
jgi:hypothetical protein